MSIIIADTSAPLAAAAAGETPWGKNEAMGGGGGGIKSSAAAWRWYKGSDWVRPSDRPPCAWRCACVDDGAQDTCQCVIIR